MQPISTNLQFLCAHLVADDKGFGSSIEEERFSQ